MYGQRLARNISVKFIIDPAERTEPIRSIPSFKFPRKLDVEDRNKTIFEAQKGIADLKL